MENEPSLTQLRSLYQQALTQKKEAVKFEKLLANIDTSATPVVLCYKGVATMMQAKYAVNPLTKFKKFNDGKALITIAVNRDTTNMEMRCLRYTMQYNAPGFLGYDANLKDDRLFLAGNIAQVNDVDLKAMVTQALALNELNK